MKNIVSFSQFVGLLREVEELAEAESKAMDAIVNGNADYAMLSAFTGDDANANSRANEKLKHALDLKKMGGYQVIGFYASDPAEPPSKELSFLVVRPQNIAPEAFRKAILSIGEEFDQDSVLIRIAGKAGVYSTSPENAPVGSVKSADSESEEEAWGNLRGDVVPVTVRPEQGEQQMGDYTIIYRKSRMKGGEPTGVSRMVGFRSPQAMEIPKPKADRFSPKAPSPAPKMESKKISKK